MYPDHIPVEFLIMYRSIHLMEFAERIGHEIPEDLEPLFWDSAERTINHQLDKDFIWFPSWPTYCPVVWN